MTKSKTTKKKGASKTEAPETRKQEREPIPWLINPVTGEPDPNTGVDYDWNKINKAYKALGCPDDIFDPTTLPWGHAKYYHLASARSVGKTTNVLLWCMAACELYPGSQIMYVRTREAMIERRYLDNTIGLMSVIRSFHYIEKITNGRWNGVEYYARVWRYVNIDPETGKTIEKCPTAFMVCVDIDQSETYRSTLNAPQGDFIIVDELVAANSRDYREGEFVGLCQLIKTIARDRLSPVVITLMNSLDIYNPYLKEFGIQKTFAALQEGAGIFVKSPKGTTMWCEYIGAKSKLRPLVNSAYFGFDNPLLSSITGGSGWAITPYPHIWKDETRQILQRGICLMFQDNIIELEVCMNEGSGLHICAHPLRKLPDDNHLLTVYVTEPPRQAKEVYGFGTRRPIDRLIWGLFSENKWFFSDDETGGIVDHYYAAIK